MEQAGIYTHLGVTTLLLFLHVSTNSMVQINLFFLYPDNN